MKPNDRTCDRCAKVTIHALGYYYEYTVPNKNRLKIQMSGMNLCGVCMKEYFGQLTPVIAKCLTCKETKPTLGYTSVNKGEVVITFCNNWWNEGSNCLDCINEVFDNGEPAADVYDNSKIEFHPDGSATILTMGTPRYH